MCDHHFNHILLVSFFKQVVAYFSYTQCHYKLTLALPSTVQQNVLYVYIFALYLCIVLYFSFVSLC
jgi:hypothetical protein